MNIITVKKISYIYMVEWQIKGRKSMIFFNNKKDIDDNIKNLILKKAIFIEIGKIYPEILL